MMPEEKKSSGKGILIIGGLIIGGIVLAFVLKPKPAQTTSSSLPASSLIQQMQEHINQLEQINSILVTPAPIPTLEPQTQVLLQPERPQPSQAQNLIQYKDGSVTDADVVHDGESYRNKESWSIKRDADGAIVGIDVERNATVGINGPS